MLFLLIILTVTPQSTRNFRVSAVQETQVWIEGGLLDGLQEGMDGEIHYEITIAGQKKRIVPAKARLFKVEDRNSVATLHDESGIINVGCYLSLIPKPPSDLLTFFNTRAREVFSAKDYPLSKAYYQRILEALPDDPFALQKIRDCDLELDKLAALARERRNVPYYKQVIQSSLESKSPESARLALTYADKILAVLPGDPYALRIKTEAGIRDQGSGAGETGARDQGPGTGEAGNGGQGSGTRVLLVIAPEPEKKEPIATTQPQAPPVTKTEPEIKARVAMAEPPIPDPRSLTPASPAPALALRDMVLVPSGTYSIGSVPERSPFANELPKHEIRLNAFYLDKYEVTNEDYKRFCDATGRGSPSYFDGSDVPSGQARKPVVMVSWIDADAYCRWAGKRLPTELEWESAAAGPSGRAWPWGDGWDPSLAATRESSLSEPSEVGAHPSDVSPFGVFDMAGNVSEWTADWYRPYPGNTRKEKEYGEQFKVLRGGSVKTSKEFARSQFRARLSDGFRSSDLGFRCAAVKQ